MHKLKKILSLILLTVLLLSLATPGFANQAARQSPFKVEIDYSSAHKNANGTTTYDIVNKAEFAKAHDLDVEDIKDVKVVLFNNDRVQRMEGASSVSPQSSLAQFFIDNLDGPSSACGTKKISQVSSVNNSSYTVQKDITLTGTVSNTYSLSVSGTVGITAAQISAGVGFDVTASWSMSDSTVVTLAPGQRVTVTAYPLIDIWEYDVMVSEILTGTKKVGTGTARETIGFCTTVT